MVLLNIHFKRTDEHSNADGLSRLPLPRGKEDERDMDPIQIFHMEQIERLPVSVPELHKETLKDPVLAQVYQATMYGWPFHVKDNPDLGPYFRRREELTVQDGDLLWGIRVIVPEGLQQRVLDELHEGHVKVVKMKGLARSYTWWPGIDEQIEGTCKACLGCQLSQGNPDAASLHRWEFPEKPWSRIHVDFAGPFMNHMFFLAIDAHSKWPEVRIMQSTTTAKTIEALRNMFATHGLPAQLV